MQENLPIRKRIRIKNYDYTKENIYFITICVKDRLELLGSIRDRLELLGSIRESNNIELTPVGKIVKQHINKIEKIYDNTRIDEYIIMPNHIHILLKINYRNDISISKIIKHYKTNVSKETTYSIWQKSFYEHIVRTEKEYLKIKEYIQNNVINWKNDKYF